MRYEEHAVSNGMTMGVSPFPCLNAARNHMVYSGTEEILRPDDDHMRENMALAPKFSESALFFQQSGDKKLSQKVLQSWEIVDAFPDFSEILNAISKELWLSIEQRAMNHVHIQWGNELVCRIMEIGHLLNRIHIGEIAPPDPEIQEEIYAQWLEINSEKESLINAIGTTSIPAKNSWFWEFLESNDFDKGLMGICTIMGGIVTYLAGIGATAPILIAVSIPFGLSILGGIIRVAVSVSGRIAAQKTKNAERLRKEVFNPMIYSLEIVQNMFNVISAQAAEAILCETKANTKAVVDAGESLNNLQVSTKCAAKELSELKKSHSEVRKDVADMKILFEQQFGEWRVRLSSNDSDLSDISDISDLRIGQPPSRSPSPETLELQNSQAALKKEFTSLNAKLDTILKAMQNNTNSA